MSAGAPRQGRTAPLPHAALSAGAVLTGGAEPVEAVWLRTEVVVVPTGHCPVAGEVNFKPSQLYMADHATPRRAVRAGPLVQPPTFVIVTQVAAAF